MSERTQILTVLFTDIVESTATLTRLRHDAADDLRSRHFGVIRSALAMHGGHEVKTLGDGVMAVFDSTNDALACSVTIHRGVAFHNRVHPELTIAMRIGVSAGEVTRAEDDYFGIAVVEASRLCAMAGGDDVVTSDIVRALAGAQCPFRFEAVGRVTLKGLAEPTDAWRVQWDAGEEFALRVALADDSFLLREGLAHVLDAEGIEVVLQVAHADGLVESLAAVRPHVVVLDMRMPPTHTTEGLRAAERIRAEHPHIGVLLLSHVVDPAGARRLLAAAPTGVGYLLKERIGDIAALTAAIRTVAAGGVALDADVQRYLDEHPAC